MKINNRYLAAFIVTVMVATALMPFAMTVQSDDSYATDPPYANEYYYKQLEATNPDAKKIYERVWNASKNLTPTISLNASEYSEGEYPTVTAVETGFYACLYDNPDLFWLKSSHNINKVMGNRVSGIGLNYTVGDEATKTEQQSRIDTVVNNIVIDEEFTYGKVRHIHDWLVDNIYYDKAAVSDSGAFAAHSIYGPFADGKCVCEGYAKAFKYLCDKNDIETILVIGEGKTSSGSEAHMWNYIKMEDDKWYCMDVTWDDPLVNDSDSGKIYYDYFLKGYENENDGMTFADSHVVDMSVTMDSGKINLGLSMPTTISPENYRFQPGHESDNVVIDEDSPSFTVDTSKIDDWREEMGPDGTLSIRTKYMEFRFTCDQLETVRNTLGASTTFELGCSVSTNTVKCFPQEFLQSIGPIADYRKELDIFIPMISTGDVSSLGLDKITIGVKTDMAPLDLKFFMYAWDVTDSEHPESIKADYDGTYETFEVSSLGVYSAGNNPITPALNGIPFVLVIAGLVLAVLLILLLIKSFLRKRKVKKLAKKMARSKKNMEHYKSLYQAKELSAVERDAYLRARKIRKKMED